jgi:hypothetical protein
MLYYEFQQLTLTNMSFLKYLQRLERIDYLIRRKATGTPEEFASRMNLCRSALMGYIREMKKLGAPIAYCKQRQSYYYEEEKQLFFGFIKNQLSEDQSRNVMGGSDYFFKKISSPNIIDLRHLPC